MDLSRRGFILSASLSTIGAVSSNKPSKKSTWFVARTPYIAQGKIVKKFELSIVDWFSRYCRSGITSKDLFGVELDYISGLFEKRPFVGSTNFSKKGIKAVLETLNNDVYGFAEGNENFVEHLGDDDENDFIYSWIDFDYAKKHPDRFAYLIQDDWLPTKVDTALVSKPSTFLFSKYPETCADTEAWTYVELKGHRLERIGDVASVLQKAYQRTLESDEPAGKLIPFSSENLLEELKSVAHDKSWKEFLSQMVVKTKQPDDQSALRCSKHICELRHHYDTWRLGQAGEQNVFNQLIVVDDFWANSHKNLFKSIKALRRGRILNEG